MAVEEGEFHYLSSMKTGRYKDVDPMIMKDIHFE
jgi:hypothetical protein